jgi:S-adenosylmethionine synthetase
MDTYIFSSESVGEGHPDKVADTISDAVLDACLATDKYSRVACETFVKSNVVVIGGEITTKAKLDFETIARKAIREIGYVNDDDVFHADKVFINLLVTQQSPDISQGVDAKKAVGKKTAKQGAGDQGPDVRLCEQRDARADAAPIMFAHRLGRQLTKIRKAGGAAWLRPDAKSQVSVVYENGKPSRIANVVNLHAARGGRLAQGNREVLHRERHQEVPAGADDDQQDRVPDQPDRPLRRRRSAG